MSIAFVKDMTVAYGAVEQVSPLIRRVLARNPGPFTFHGTGTYIVGRGRVAIIDPGPALDEHVEAVLAAVAGETVSHLLITHTHCDHSPAAAVMAARTGAVTCGFGPHGGGNDRAGAVEEGADHDFSPALTLADGDATAGPGWTLTAVHTPGHTSNHLCFALAEEGALFSGDHVMGWSTTVIVPPDGDMAAYVASLRRLLDRDETIHWPTHGPPIRAPKPHLRALITHRRLRERQILYRLAVGIDTVPALVAAIYADIPQRLRPAAGRCVLAHLIDLAARGKVTTEGSPGLDGKFALAPS